MKNVVFTKKGWNEYVYWQQQNVKIARKINALLQSIIKDGTLSGTGKPEKLKYCPGNYSRRIDDANRLVYSVNEDELTVIACKGHYED